MAAWSAAARSEHAPSRAAQPQTVRRRRAPGRRPFAGGLAWIALLAVLLAGVVALNVAVLRLNMRLDHLARQRDQLRGDNAALSSQLSSAAAAGRIQNIAMRRLGFVQATPAETTFVHLGR